MDWARVNGAYVTRVVVQQGLRSLLAEDAR